MDQIDVWIGEWNYVIYFIEGDIACEAKLRKKVGLSGCQEKTSEY